VLRGVGATMVGLPFLEYFAPARAGGKPVPKQLAFLFGGLSIGSADNPRITPATPGTWQGPLPRALQPLTDHAVADATTLVTGLDLPAGIMPPPGGRQAQFHSTSHPVIPTGQRFAGPIDGRLRGPSVDWVAANVLAQGTPFPALVYRAQPAFYRTEAAGDLNGIISARRNAQDVLEQVPPITSPRVAFESLFGSFIPPGQAEAEAARRSLRMRTSVVDRVADDANALVGRLGAEDRIRMQRHFDELRTLETQLAAIEVPDPEQCPLPRHPGDDPPIGDAVDPALDGDYAEFYMNANGYSDEDARARIMTELVYFAFVCGLSRVASFMITHATCCMNMYPLIGVPSDLHGISHAELGQDADAVADAMADAAAWHVSHYARLVERLRGAEAEDGGSLLDHSAVVLAFEGGWGEDVATGDLYSPHSTQHMAMLVGGGAGGLNATGGGHLPAPGVHPTAVLNTVLEALGVDETLGEVTTKLDALLG
jgi:hypothetical protein